MRHFARAILVSLITCIVVAAGRSGPAQELVARPRPTTFPGHAMQMAAIADLRATLASTFDRDAPPVTMDGWLFQTLASRVEMPRTHLADWSMTGCDDPQSPLPGAGADFCIEAVVPLTASKQVHLLFVAGEAVRVGGDKLQWRRTASSLRDAFISWTDEGPGDSLDVPSLHELESMLQLPRDQWPMADLQPSVTLTPAVPVGGEPVLVTIEVANRGRRSLDRAHVNVVIGWCCPQEEVRKDWFPRLSAGHSVRMTVALPTSDPSMLALASARPGPSLKRVRESAPDRSTAVAAAAPRPRPQ